MPLGLTPLAVYTDVMNNVFSIAHFSSIVLLVGILVGCESLPEPRHDNTNPKATIKHTADSLAPPSTLPQEHEIESVSSLLSTDTLYSLLVAEVAASRRQYGTTINNYVEQAKETNNKGIIIRAARISQFLRAHQNALDMGVLWLHKDSTNIEALSTVANAHIELQQPLLAVDYIAQVLEQSQSTQTNIKQNSDSTDNTDNTKSADGGALVETLANFNRQTDKATLIMLITNISLLADRFPASAGIQAGLSTLHQAAGDNDRARDWIDKALDNDATRTSAIIQDLRLLQSTQQNSLALTKLKQYVNNVPGNHRLRLIYARMLSQSNIAEAYKQFTILAEQSPSQLDLRFSRALLATELKKMDIAKSLFESLFKENYQTDNINYYLGHIHDFQAEPSVALSYYLSVKQGDHFLSAQYRAASVYLEQDRLDNAQSLFAELHKQLPGKTEQHFESEASLLVKYKADQQAMVLLNKAIAQFPDNAALRYERATVYERQDNIVLMEQDFRHALTLEPNNVSSLNGLGYLLSVHTERYDEAYTLISKALSLNPDDAAIIDSMGWVLFKLNRLEEAITYLQQAYEKHPNAEIAAHLVEALWVNGQQDVAKKIAQESLIKEPDALDIPKTLQRLGIEW
ncbi:MAG: tetratricopeptide (TPR) repeat protein [Granulosicoccus sp.]|jgi:tetratricopeptide (TPR) repeat protein